MTSLSLHGPRTAAWKYRKRYWKAGARSMRMLRIINEVGFNRIAAAHDVNNPKSGRVMQKAGMTYEGIWRAAGKNNIGVVDEVWYSILKDEYKQVL